MNQLAQYVERISALHRSVMRRFAQEEELQTVHLEILVYLTQCNRYSDTTQALSDYLGQTKGSISQSLSLIEELGFIKRQQDARDKRVFHLLVTPKGRNLVQRFNEFFQVPNLDEKGEAVLSVLLTQLQMKNRHKAFGICASCKYNRSPGKNKFVCGLTQENLSLEDVQKRCREHESA